MNEQDKKSTSDRALGDEWSSWDGNIENYEWNINEPTSTFFKFALIEIFLINIIVIFLIYISSPRLMQLSNYLYMGVNFSVILFLLFINCWFLAFFLSQIFNKNFFFFSNKINIKLANIIFNKISKHAKIFGISQDRLSSSYIKINNTINNFMISKKNTGKLLLLLPRCLTKENYKEIRELTAKYNIETATVAGGSLARQKIKEICPSKVIGVACERDLVSGIKDVSGKLNVFGIPNIRPNGPCKNTYIDISILRDTIEKCLNKK